MEYRYNENGNKIFCISNTLCETSTGVFIPFYAELAHEETGIVCIDTTNTPNSPIIVLDEKAVNSKLKYEVHGTTTVHCLADMNIECYDNSYVVITGKCNVEAYGNSYVKDLGNSSIVLHNNAKAIGAKSSAITAYDSSEAILLKNSTATAYNNSIVINYENGNVQTNDNARYENRSENELPISCFIAHEIEDILFDTVQILIAKKDQTLFLGATIEGIPEVLTADYDRLQVYNSILNDLHNNNGLNIQLAISLMEYNMESHTDILSYHHIHDVCKDLADYRAIKIHEEYSKNITQNQKICRKINSDGDSIIFNADDKSISIIHYNIKADMREFVFADIPSIKGAISCRTITADEISKACTLKKNFEDVAVYLSKIGKTKASCPYYNNFAKYATLYNPPANFSAPHMKIKDYVGQAKELIKFIDDNIRFDIPLYKTIQNEMKKIVGMNSRYANVLINDYINKCLLTVERTTSDIPENEYHLTRFVKNGNGYDFFEEYVFTEREIGDILKISTVINERTFFEQVFDNIVPVITYMYNESFAEKAELFINISKSEDETIYVQSEISKDNLLKFIDETNNISLVLPFNTDD